jgi:hypothetical protein
VSKNSRRNFDQVNAENARLREQNSQLRRFGAFNGATKVCGELVRAARVVLPWYFIYRTAAAFAGRTSTIDASGAVRVESDSISKALERIFTEGSLFVLFAIIGVAGLAFGYNQLRLRQRVIEHLSPYQQKYEALKDPKRSSSQLSPKGETRPGDE